jgi:peptidoglycan/xylan/chitin deacetylase (PgdA/CDA1 family)
VINNVESKEAALVTTSWDDGDPLDIRLAELLASYGIKGTFYVPIHNDGNPLLAIDQLHLLRRLGMEIGSHTLTHPVLTRLGRPRIEHELRESKKILEDTLGEPVSSFSYPKGKFNRTVRTSAVEAGYRMARATQAFRTETRFDPFCMPVSFQFYPHSQSIHARHALGELNLKGIMNWCMSYNMEKDLSQLSELVFGHVSKNGGVFHIWGHSWELEQFGLWDTLEKVLKHIANRPGVLYLTNSEVLDITAK